MNLFVVDSNFFIQAHRASYPIDIALSFWKKVRQLAHEGKIISIDKVRAEIVKNDDELTRWVNGNLPDTFFRSTQEKSILDEYRKVVNWASSKSGHYKQKAIDEFLEFDKADAWLIAWCLVSGDQIVTQEVSEPNRKVKIKIPDACQTFGVSYLNMMQMLRHLGVSF
ncbi:MAG: DUF4411 family protein [Balneolales bacterium]